MTEKYNECSISAIRFKDLRDPNNKMETSKDASPSLQSFQLGNFDLFDLV